MTLAKKLYEVVVLGLVWLPAAALATVVIAKEGDIFGGAPTAYVLMAMLVALAFVATEYVLEALKVDTVYAPD